MNIDMVQLQHLIAIAFLPLARIGGFVMVAPVFSGRFIPARIRIIIALALTLLVAPVLPVSAIELFSPAGFLAVVTEVIAGAALGFVYALVFDAIMLAAEFLSIAIGLGFAQLVDPARGVPTPALGQFYSVTSLLLFLSINGHLMLLHMLVQSWQVLPAGTVPDAVAFGDIARLSAFIFSGAMALALPALMAMLLTNLAYAVISRAAPALNLFAVGFPLTMLFGLVFLFLTIGLMPLALQRLLADASQAASLLRSVP